MSLKEMFTNALMGRNGPEIRNELLDTINSHDGSKKSLIKICLQIFDKMDEQVLKQSPEQSPPLQPQPEKKAQKAQVITVSQENAMKKEDTLNEREASILNKLLLACRTVIRRDNARTTASK